MYFERLTLACTRGMGVYIERGEGCRINGCSLRNMGIVAVCIGKGIEAFPYGQHDGCGNKADGLPGQPVSRELGSWHEHIYKFTAFNREGGRDHGVVSCDIYNIDAGGIHLGGGDRKTLAAAGNFGRNCDIHDFNRLDRSYKAGVNVDGVGNRIEHCNIYSAPGSGLYVHGNDHIFEYNEMHHVLLEGDDMGGGTSAGIPRNSAI